MAAFLDICRYNPTAGGTTDWTFSSAVTGYASPALAGVANGRAYKYRAESADLSQWEVGEGTYNTATGVLTRTTILYNSAGTGTATGQSGAGTKISFAAAPQVAIVALKEDLISIEEANSFTAAQKTRAQENINFSTVIVGAVDLNTIVEPGTYACQTNTITNGPYAGGQWYIDVTVYAGDPTNYIMQRATDLVAANGTWIRCKVAGTFTAWKGISKAPTVQRLTSGAGATYTTPAGCTRLRIRMVGGGGGGAGGNNAAGATAGSATTFSGGTLSAPGGGAAGGTQNGGQGNIGTGGNILNVAGDGGKNGSVSRTGTVGIGGAGGSSMLGGGGRSSNGTGETPPANSGGGGGGGAASNAAVDLQGGAGAAGGGGVEHIINAPAATYTYTIGPGGAGTAGGTNGSAGGTGGSGLIIVEEYYD